jgi:hypothetical protein
MTTMTRSRKTSRWIQALGWLGRRPARRGWSARAARAVILAGVSASLTLGSGPAVAQAADQAGLPVKALAKSCDLRFMPTKPTVTGPSILGNAFAVCDVPPERHVLTLSLQYRQGGSWKTAESASSTEIPNPKAVYEVKTGCRPGLWRVNARVVGTLQGRDFEFEDNSIERFVTAADCERGSR